MINGAYRTTRLALAACLVGLAGIWGCQDGTIALPPVDPGMAARVAAGLGRPGPCNDAENAEAMIRDLVEAVNAERAKRRIRPLRPSPVLMTIADFYACRLVDGRFMAHVDPYDGSTVVERAADFGYDFWKVGENLAARQRTVQEALADWMASPAHRANVLDPAFTEIGAAVKDGGEFGRYWVLEFGRPLSAADLILNAAGAPDSVDSPATSQPDGSDSAAPATTSPGDGSLR